MNIGILSRNENLYSTKRLVEAAKIRGHDVRVIDYLRCYLNIAPRNPQIYIAGSQIRGIDAVIPRIGATHTFYGTAVVRQFEMMGVFSLNKSQAISRSRDKLRCLQVLARKGVGLPVTGCTHSPKDVKDVIHTIGGAPLVIKLLEGTQGIGVVLAETNKAAESVMEAFRELNAYILVQEYIREAAGCDVRCFVVGDQVIAAMQRIGAPGEFRSNIHRGGKGEQVEIAAEERKSALLAARAMGLNVCGVDILRSQRGPVVMEVNSSPGLEGIESTTGIDVAGAIVAFIEKSAAPRGEDQDPIDS